MNPNTAPIKNRWVFSLLWTNAAVALVDLVVIATAPLHTLHSILQTLAFTFIYANLTSILALLVLGWLLETLAKRKLLNSKLPVWTIALPGILVFCAGGCLLAQAILAAFGFSPSHHFWLDYFHTLRFALPLALVFGLGAMTHASLLTRVHSMEHQLHEKELSEERTRKLAAETRLRSLESWIHPHFLFNTLNSISARIPQDPTRAEQIVGRLATLLRASLDSSSHSLIPLRQELALVESYLDIERVRLGEKLHATIEVPAAALAETKVPPLSIQHLVENAVKYGITPQPNGGTILISALPDDNAIRIEIRDSGPGFDLPAIPASHGLDKLTQRLDALYGENASLKVFRRDNISIVQMTVPRS
jgi:two-component system sensor histidine kinase AlgZ